MTDKGERRCRGGGDVTREIFWMSSPELCPLAVSIRVEMAAAAAAAASLKPSVVVFTHR